MSQISFVTTSGAGSPGELRNLPAIANYLVWYAKDRDQLKYRQSTSLSVVLATTSSYAWLELADGSRRHMTPDELNGKASLPEDSRPYRIGDLTSQSGVDKTRFPVVVDGVEYRPRKGVWKTSQEGMARLQAARRVQGSGDTLSYVRFLDDFDGRPLTNVWNDTVQSGFGAEKQYVVQTNPRVVARCILMTTDAGDLVLDPTCGAGTTAYVAEQYGRRWVTVDTSRVALAIARERVLTARYDCYELVDANRGVDGGLKYKTLQRVTLRSIARAEEPEQVTLYDDPLIVKGRVRVTGPFTVEALSRYAVNPTDKDTSEPDPTGAEASDHVDVLLAALKTQGIPRPGDQPAVIESLTPLSAVGALQAEGVAELGGKRRRFAVALGPKFGAITMAQVSDALREAIGFDLVVFAGFAVSADAQDKLATGKIGGTQVSLLLANPDLLVGDLLKNTRTSQTFRLYSAPDVKLEPDGGGYRVSVVGVDSFDAATGEVVSFGKAGIQAWFLDDDYDGTVFRVSQAFFPVTDAWEKLQAALRGTVDAALLEEFHGWTSLPFEQGEHPQVAVRVVAKDGNAAEVMLPLPGAVVTVASRAPTASRVGHRGQPDHQRPLRRTDPPLALRRTDPRDPRRPAHRRVPGRVTGRPAQDHRRDHRIRGRQRHPRPRAAVAGRRLPRRTTVTRDLLRHWFDDGRLTTPGPSSASRKPSRPSSSLPRRPGTAKSASTSPLGRGLHPVGREDGHGTGKTLVMALHRMERTQQGRQPARPSVQRPDPGGGPNITVQDRLAGAGGLDPKHPESVFAEFDLIPPQYSGLLGQIQLQVMNWHSARAQGRPQALGRAPRTGVRRRLLPASPDRPCPYGPGACAQR